MSLDYFFNPDGIAILGASDNTMKGGYHILNNVMGGYKGRIYPVNPRYESLLGLPCYPDIDAIPENFDLVIYFIPAKALPETIEKCARKKVKGIIIESAGFSEVGAQGRLLQEECLALALKHGIRLWGPNCMGLLDAHRRYAFTFHYSDAWKTLLVPGKAALIVQSGMLSAGFLMMILERGGTGLSKVCSIGNKCDVDETELLEYLIDDPQTEVIGMYVEAIRDGRRFLDLARSTSKPIIVLKGGRSPSGAKAAMSHTASLAGDFTIMRHAFNQAGIITVYDLHEFMDLMRGFSMAPVVHTQGGSAVATFSGGAGIVTTDFLYDNGLSMATLAPETLDTIKTMFPDWMDPSNPVDLWPGIEQNGSEKVYKTVLGALMRDPGVDSLIVHIFAALLKGEHMAEIARLQHELGKPVAVWLVGLEKPVRSLRAELEEQGLPVFDSIIRAVGYITTVKRRKPRNLPG